MYVATQKSISPTFRVCCDKEKNNLVDDMYIQHDGCPRVAVSGLLLAHFRSP